MRYVWKAALLSALMATLPLGPAKLPLGPATLPLGPAAPNSAIGPGTGLAAVQPAPAVVGETCVAPPWLRPVDAAVVDPFRPPSNPYGPGNRGIEYGTAKGDPVRTVAAGQVVFSGSVGGHRFVVVRHGDLDGAGDSLRSTYGYLAAASVGLGERVRQGQSVGTADVGFHLTARLGETYIDPAPLMVESCYIVRLVPPPVRGA